MKIKRIIRDILELLVLSGVFWICFREIKGGHHDLVTPFTFIAYALCLIFNFFGQLFVSSTSTKTGFQLQLVRIKLFATIMLLPFLPALSFAGEDIRILLIPTTVSGIAIFYYSAAQLLISLAVLYYRNNFDQWISVTKNRYVLIVGLVLFITPQIMAYDYLDRKKEKQACLDMAYTLDSISEYEYYLERYPNDEHTDEFTFKLANKRNSLEDYKDYIAKYPSGEYLANARFNIARLTRDTALILSFINEYQNTNLSNEATQLRFLLDNSPNMFVDYRDGQKYATIRIGKQTWMAENLRYKTPNCLSSIKNTRVGDPEYGMFYSTADVTTAIPDGWHLPSIEEWTTLLDTVRGFHSSKGSFEYCCDDLFCRDGWEPFKGTNTIGFNAFPSGYVVAKGQPNNYDMNREGNAAYWWSYTKEKGTGMQLKYWQLHCLVEIDLTIDANLYLPIRCVKN